MSEYKKVIQEMISRQMIKPHMLRYAHMVCDIQRLNDAGLDLYADDGAFINVAECFDVYPDTAQRAWQEMPHGLALFLFTNSRDNSSIENPGVRELVEAQVKVAAEIKYLQAHIDMGKGTTRYLKSLREQKNERKKELAHLYRKEKQLAIGNES